MTPRSRDLLAEKYVNPRLVTKNTAASTAVVRLRKLAEPVAPKRLPDAPLPNAAPMSAPFPCWSSTSPITTSAATTCKTMITSSIRSSSFPLRLLPAARRADREKLGRDQRRAADEATVYIRHRKEARRVACLHAAA